MVGQAAFGGRGAFINLGAFLTDIVGTIKRQCFGRRAVPACATDFLIVGLDGLGQIGMSYPADIWLVDPHPEGDGRDDDQPVLGLKPGFNGSAIRGLHPAVIEAGTVTSLVQSGSQRLSFLTRTAINDAGLPFAGGREIQDLAARSILGGEGQMDIGAVEAVQICLRLLPVEQAVDDLGPCFRVGGGGKSSQRNIQRLTQRSNP